MTRPLVTLVLVGLGIGTAGAALAQGAGKVPVDQDVRRVERLDRRIDGPAQTEPVGPNANLVPADPAGVVGFNGPPGAIRGDSVNSFDPLPQGAAGADIR